MDCGKVKRLLPGYLDGAIPADAWTEAHSVIGKHLDFCSECREELQLYVNLSSMMSRVERPAPPSDLALRIRVAASQRLAPSNWLHYVRLIRGRAHLVLKNILEPLALPATGGLAVALVVFSLVYQLLVVGMPLSAFTNDSPTNLLQPARLEVLAPFPVTFLEQGHGATHELVVNATVNALGQAVSYEILSGPDDTAIRRQLDQVLLFSRFRPQMSFGRPSGGHVVLSFSGICVVG
jgi:predicted anti-sigma-YlaC factor YlaD